MLLLALLSGLVNLASQAVFLRVISAANGDYYLTYYLTTLSFICFSAVGNVLSHRLRRWLPLVEMGAGLYSLALWYGVQNGLLSSMALSTPAVVALLIPPALALGVHIPLYAHFGGQRVGVTYGVYHLGAALGVLALEWFVLPYVPLSASLGVLGSVQLVLGLWVAAVLTQRRDALALVVAVPGPTWLSWLRANQRDVLTVFLASVASYLAIAWGLKNYQYLLLPTRTHIGGYNGTVLLMLALGGLATLGLRRRSLVTLVPAAGIWLAASVLLFTQAPALLRDADYQQVEVFALTMAAVFCLPVLLSAVLFSRLAERMAGERDVVMGRLLLVSALGNLVGGVLSLASGSLLLTLWPALGSAVLLSWMLLREQPQSLPVTAHKWVGTAAVGMLVAIGQGFNPMQTIVQMRVPYSTLTGTELTTQMGNTAGYATLRPNGNLPPEVRIREHIIYFVDGHTSHIVNYNAETVVGLLAAKVLNAPLGRSLVIGLGSGQSAFGVATMSRHTDVVEISPAVMRALPTLAAYNHRVWARPDVTIYREDGLNFVRNCQPGSYDYIFNTATLPMMFNAYKLYTDEFVSAAKRCLKPGGLMQFYLDNNVASTQEQVRTFLAPMAKHFRNLYINPHPYPNILVSDRELRPNRTLDLNRIITRDADRAVLANNDMVWSTLGCSGWGAPAELMPRGQERVATLDNPVIEQTAVERRLRVLSTRNVPENSPLYASLKPINPGTSALACTSWRDGLDHPELTYGMAPLVIHLYEPNDKEVHRTAQHNPS